MFLPTDVGTQDCLAILEKRVRSRCQSQVHQVVLENTFEAFVGMAERLLYADTVQLSRDNEDLEDIADDWNAEVEVSDIVPVIEGPMLRRDLYI